MIEEEDKKQKPTTEEEYLEYDENMEYDEDEYEIIEATDCILEGRTECKTYPYQYSEILCKTMDALRASWNFIYPFECQCGKEQ